MESDDLITLLNEKKAVDFWGDVLDKLTAFNCEVVENDVPLLILSFSKVETEIKLNCNLSELPTNINAVLIDAIVGEFLKLKNAVGTLDIGKVVASVTMGDTSVSYGTPMQTFDAIISDMTDLRGVYACLRRVKF